MPEVGYNSRLRPLELWRPRVHDQSQEGLLVLVLERVVKALGAALVDLDDRVRCRRHQVVGLTE